MLNCFQDQLHDLRAVNEHLTHCSRSLLAHPAKPVSFALPDKFNGSAEKCQGFYISVRFISPVNLNHLVKKPKHVFSCCHCLLEKRSTGPPLSGIKIPTSKCRSITSLNISVKNVNIQRGGQDVSIQLLHLCKGHWSAVDDAIQFRMLAAQSGWNDMALKTVFHESLNH